MTENLNRFLGNRILGTISHYYITNQTRSNSEKIHKEQWGKKRTLHHQEKHVHRASSSRKACSSNNKSPPEKEMFKEAFIMS